MREFLRHWRCREDGVVAVEFALLAFPFFVLLLGTIEVSLFFAAGIVLEGSTVEAARLIRTGEAGSSGDPETAFRDRLCDQVDRLIPCEDIVYESIAMGDGGFTSAEDAAAQFDEDGNMVPSGFSTGASSEVVLIRSFYRYEFMMPFIGALMTGDAGENSMVLMSTAVIRNEPYQFGG